MPNQITVTAKTGPAEQVTSKVFVGPLAINFNLAEQVLSVTDSNNVIHDFDLYGVATVTYTVSGHIATVAVS